LRRLGRAETVKAVGFVLFASGEETEQVAVGLGAESFRAVAVVMQKTGSEGATRMLAVSDFKTVERGQGNAVSAIEVAERLKEIGFQLMMRVVALGFGLLGLRLRRWIGACSFTNSHQLPPSVGSVG
jgi:hypothetical protein